MFYALFFLETAKLSFASIIQNVQKQKTLFTFYVLDSLEEWQLTLFCGSVKGTANGFAKKNNNHYNLVQTK